MQENHIRSKIDAFLPSIVHLYPRIPVAETSPTDPIIRIGQKEYLVFCSNNYLGLANADFVKEAAINAITKYGYGSGGSRWMSGTTDLHLQLEQKLARFKTKEEAIIFSAGFMVNSGVIPALTGSVFDDLPFPAGEAAVFSDQLNHASIVDGCRNSKARVYVYKHKDMQHLSELLDRSKETYKLIVTDGVFSMDGDAAPLDKIVELAKGNRAMVMVDDAHGAGVMGRRGRGTAEHFNLETEVDISMGTLSKTFGALGGYVACDSSLAKYIRGAARTYIFAAAMPPSTAAAVIAILDRISDNLEYTHRLGELANYLRKGLKDMGHDTMESVSAIMPILVGKEDKAILLSQELFNYGVYLTYAIWPAVEKRRARLRVTVTANHKIEQIDRFLNILEHVSKKTKI